MTTLVERLKFTITSNPPTTAASLLDGAAAQFCRNVVTALSDAAADPFGIRIGATISLSVTDGTAWEDSVFLVGGTTAAPTLTRIAVNASSAGGTTAPTYSGPLTVYGIATGAEMTKMARSTSVQVVYLSNFVKSDTVLAADAPVAGADQRAAIQAVMDLALNGPLHVVWDVKVTIGDISDGQGYFDGVRIRGNTTIVALNGCGALKLAGSQGWILSNANPIRNLDKKNTQNQFSAIVDENITIDGGIWHGNVDGQVANGQPVKNDVFHFFGVRNLFTRNYQILRPSGMAFRLCCIDYHKNENYLIEFKPGQQVNNTDGMHYHGTARRLRDRNGTIRNGYDDSYALNADDAWLAAPFNGAYDNVYGPIYDVVVENLTIESGIFGIRLLSGASYIDDIRFKTVRGYTTAYGFLIDNFDPAQIAATGAGAFRNIRLDDFRMTNGLYMDGSYQPYATSIMINAAVQQLALTKIWKRDFNSVLFPAITFGAKANIDQLEVDFASRNYSTGNYLIDQINFLSGAVVNQADIKVRAYAPNGTNGSPVRVRSGATINQLNLSGIQTGFNSMLQADSGSTIGTVKDLTLSAAAAPASTWVLQSSAPWAEDTTVPGKLTQTANKPGTVISAKKTTTDAYGGNVKVSGTVQFVGARSGAQHVSFFVRGSNSVPWASISAGYGIDFALEGTQGVKLYKMVAVNNQQPVGSMIATALTMSTNYNVVLNANGNLISASVQRGSDGLWLQSNGTWSSTQGWAFSITDASIPAAAGEVGVYSYIDTDTTGQNLFTNITIAAAT